MKVVTYWPALVPAILRAGHEPVLMPQSCESCRRQKSCPIAKEIDGNPICNLWEQKDAHG